MDEKVRLIYLRIYKYRFFDPGQMDHYVYELCMTLNRLNIKDENGMTFKVKK